MELPQYHIPQVKTVLLHVWERLKGFIIKAGTILFLACVVMWFLGGFGFTDGGFGMVEDSADSAMAAIGGVIAPIFAPLGFGEWQPVAASISGFTAKEAIVSTMGVLANVAGDTEDAVNVAAGVASWFPTGIAAFSFLMFNLPDSPCLAAIATMAKEMNDRKWFWFRNSLPEYIPYIVCLCFYQIGSFVTGGAFGIGTVVSCSTYRNAVPAVQTRSVQRSESLLQTFCTGIRNYEIIKGLDTKILSSLCSTKKVIPG